MNKIKKGSYYRLKTKKWYEAQGYEVSNAEVTKMAFFSGKLVPIRKDIFGADLIAMNGKEILFIQSKTHHTDMSKGAKEFEKFPFPKSVKRLVIRWEPRSRFPIIRKV